MGSGPKGVLDRQEDTFVHEVELGDFDGDGMNEDAAPELYVAAGEHQFPRDRRVNSLRESRAARGKRRTLYREQ